MALLALLTTSGLVWGVEQGGTYLLLSLLKQQVGAASFKDLLVWLLHWAEHGSNSRLLLSALTAVLLQLLPIFNGILLAALLGAMWGTWKGLAAASFGVTLSAIFCLLLSRYVLRRCLPSDTATGMPPLMAAVATAIASSSAKSFLFISLFRFTPLIPFVWSNYLFGLTPIPLLPYSVATFLASLPPLFAFVSGGVVGKAVADGSVSAPPGLIVFGVLATVGILVFIGRVSREELQKLARREQVRESEEEEEEEREPASEEEGEGQDRGPLIGRRSDV